MSTISGLARWRAAQAETRNTMMLKLEILRKTAHTEMYEGREFSVVVVPDQYGVNGPSGGKPEQTQRGRRASYYVGKV